MADNIFSRMKAVQGDISELPLDAIVNAANTSLLGGGGVDGAIHHAAGTGLLEECQKLGGCPTGDARMTKGYRLPARFVIHAVGPVYRDGKHGEPELLRSCYRESLRLASEGGFKSVAFPCISTGAYRFPKDQACEIAISAVTNWLKTHDLPQEVTFCCFGIDDLALYQARLAEL